MTPTEPPVHKIAYMGTAPVGRTSSVLVIFLGHLPDFDPGIEDTYSKQIVVDGTACKVELYDPHESGECAYKWGKVIQHNDSFVFMYSVSSRNSFEQIQGEWDRVVRTKRNEDATCPPPVAVLVGNKCDLPDAEREVSRQEGEELARKLKVLFFEASAKQQINVREPVDELVRETRRRATSKRYRLLQFGTAQGKNFSAAGSLKVQRLKVRLFKKDSAARN